MRGKSRSTSLTDRVRNVNPYVFTAITLAVFALVCWGLTFLVKTPTGTVRVAMKKPIDGLEVLVDGETISLSTPETLAAEEHQLALKLGNTFLDLDPATNQFVHERNGNETRLAVSIGSLRLSDTLFEVMRNAETVLKIEAIEEKSARTELSENDSSDEEANDSVHSPVNIRREDIAHHYGFDGDFLDAVGDADGIPHGTSSATGQPLVGSASLSVTAAPDFNGVELSNANKFFERDSFSCVF